MLLGKSGVHNTNSAELIVQRNAVIILDGCKNLAQITFRTKRLSNFVVDVLKARRTVSNFFFSENALIHYTTTQTKLSSLFILNFVQLLLSGFTRHKC